MTTESLALFVQHYVVELRYGDSDNAFHCLTEADAAIVPLLVAEFTRHTDATFRRDLVDVIAEFGSPESVRFFAKRLLDEHWKTALDFLVGQHSPEAIAALEQARSRTFATQAATDEFRVWLEEAIEQATSPVRSPLHLTRRCS